jgi:hypothetical protein
MNATPIRRLALALAASVALAGQGAAQTAEPAPADETPVVVEEDAPPGSSAAIAGGAIIGVVVGALLLALIVGSGSSD